MSALTWFEEEMLNPEFAAEYKRQTEEDEAEQRTARALAKIASEQVSMDPEIAASIAKNLHRLYVK